MSLSAPAKPLGQRKRTLKSYTLKGSDVVIKPRGTVLLKAPDSSKSPYVARVEAIEAAGSRGTNVRVKVRWYYWPEDSIIGRQAFHGAKEVFLSGHQDVQSVDAIEGKCNVYSFPKYTKLDVVNDEDYFCRFEYNEVTGKLVPDTISVYCKCWMPCNPDDLMIQCEECTDWFHPACIGKTIKEAKKLEHFSCESCAAEKRRRLKESSEQKIEIVPWSHEYGLID